MRLLSKADVVAVVPSKQMNLTFPFICLVASLVVTAVSALPQASKSASDGWLNLTVIHTNDVHSRVDPANEFGVSCTKEDIATGHCYGGTARHKTVIEDLRKKNQHSLLLDGGDEFQGTLFYSYYKGNVTAEVMNELGYDLTTIGNHEWDNGPANLGRFWSKLKFPIVCANVDLSKNPELQKWVKPYHIFEDLGLAVIGYITNTTGDISNAGPTIAFTDPIPAVQRYVDELEAKGIKRILGLSHNGYGPDMELAAKTHGIDLIVGGHSHSYLGDPKNKMYEGPYPTVIKNLKGENTLIVQAFCWGRYIGHLDVVFNSDGKIVSWKGVPVLVENSIVPNALLLERIDGWRKEFEEWGETVLGVASQEFDQQSCKQRECTMGNMVADAMLQHARTATIDDSKNGLDVKDERPWVDFAFVNSGGIRAGLPAGNITIEMVTATFPFGNRVVQTQMSGEEILDLLEAISSGRNKKSQKLLTSNIQISGLRFTYDSSRPLSESHLIKAEIQGFDRVWRDIKKTKIYWIATLDFILRGGDNLLEPKTRERVFNFKLMDEALMDYIKNEHTITPYLDGRIKDVVRSKSSFTSRDHEWPAGVPEYLKSQYIGGFNEMLRDYVRLREGSSTVLSHDDSIFESTESRQKIWN
ncbi:Metallo-dependent phosphatase-like protein [Lobosporangium transversale]|uniref:Metallo-dependent phosphatase-like protein n=1 Tax=Lobosporangium transversale TaxID=64571 RepID=A0A1Y2GLF5_9FUNG|nr:Metallo-dependent phosphatase-like protein [Lobosporangium transversale]ORZ14338.1 Metallo-dependent phosphatase-like protein [Lobosporangium transversale]|eukprot:XP_021880816.1 Metallo-dependent phosphatase-like protein [Lobosporangium transversale]